MPNKTFKKNKVEKKKKSTKKKSTKKKTSLKSDIDKLYQKISDITDKSKLISLDEYDGYQKQLDLIEKKLKSYEDDIKNELSSSEESLDTLTWDEFQESYQDLQKIENKVDNDEEKYDLSTLIKFYKDGNQYIKNCTHYLDSKKATIKIEK